MASPNTIALNDRIRKLRANVQIEMAGHPGNRETRRKAAKDLVKRLKKGPIYGMNKENQLVIVESQRTSMSFYEALNKV